MPIWGNCQRSLTEAQLRESSSAPSRQNLSVSSGYCRADLFGKACYHDSIPGELLVEFECLGVRVTMGVRAHRDDRHGGRHGLQVSGVVVVRELPRSRVVDLLDARWHAIRSVKYSSIWFELSLWRCR